MSYRAHSAPSSYTASSRVDQDSVLSAPRRQTVSLPTTPPSSLGSFSAIGSLPTPPNSGSPAPNSPLCSLLSSPHFSYDMRLMPQYPAIDLQAFASLSQSATSTQVSMIIVELPVPISGFPRDSPLVISSKTGSALTCYEVLEALYYELRKTDYCVHLSKLGALQKQMVETCFNSRIQVSAPQTVQHEVKRGIRRIDFHGIHTRFGGLTQTSGGWYRLALIARSHH
ncbi:hypothetical protein SISSUDRAFT_1062177 [Sistotremastrum suecicum HHB10207 ss-3]|uniref:DUF6699 domain-containing protein n=1 Tax=Sistotremastrum suecicum HHB10207 ss-3 TaxID=1314776 RepID=A0A166D8M0_9AGAM|nr:hypothetical protein SISSUDRAFT_1062177 [Sistotremastrum suecicum HHB10207 ss-3]